MDISNEKKRTAKQVVDSCYADISLIVKNIDHRKEKKLKKQANK
jgi:hypothetical protein